MAKKETGRAITVCGVVEPKELGAVMMHEHLHSDIYRWDKNEMIVREEPTAPERRAYLMREAVPHLKRLREFGCRAFVDTTPEPWRAWPTLYREISEAAGVHIVLCCGFYREMEMGKYWVKKPEDRIWPRVVSDSVEELTDHLVKQIREGIHGTGIRAGAIKLGTSQPPMTELEVKTFRVGARVQKKTGVHITTHCTWLGSETSQLTILEREGVDLSRVVIGHTAGHLMSPQFRKTVLAWMARGANFLPTNMGVKEGKEESWRPLVEGIHEVFQAGHGDKLVLGLDSGYCSESCEFGPMKFLPPHPWTHLYTHTLPAFRRMGLTPAEEQAMMETNPQRIIPVR